MNGAHPIQIPAAYYVESTGYHVHSTTVATRPTLGVDHEGNYIEWESNSRGGRHHYSKLTFDAKEIKMPLAPLDTLPQTIEFKTEGKTYKLIKLTIKIFNEKLKPYVARGGSMNFQTDQEVQDHFLKTF